MIIEHYGDILFKLGEKKEAIDQWKKAKLIDSGSELLDKKILNEDWFEEGLYFFGTILYFIL